MKKRLTHGFGVALMLFSPLWITMHDPPSYTNFAISLALGILLLVLSSQMDDARRRH